jgi:hypothetical protein
MASNFLLQPIEDPYSILGIHQNATQDELKKAYYEKAKLLHPDKNAKSTDELRELRGMQMKQLTASYHLLVNDRAKADELHEKSQDQDAANEGIRVTNGYLTLDKRFSDKFRVEFNSNSANSFVHSLNLDLNLMKDEKFKDYMPIQQKLSSNINMRLRCETCDKTFRSLRKKYEHQALVEHTRFLDPIYLSTLATPDRLLERGDFPLNVSIFHDDEWNKMWTKKEVFNVRTCSKANQYIEIMNKSTLPYELIEQCEPALNHLRLVFLKDNQATSIETWLHDAQINEFVANYAKNNSDQVLEAFYLENDRKPPTSQSINNIKKRQEDFISLAEVNPQAARQAMFKNFKYKVGACLSNKPGMGKFMILFYSIQFHYQLAMLLLYVYKLK